MTPPAPLHALTIDEAFAMADALHVPASFIFPTADNKSGPAPVPTPPLNSAPPFAALTIFWC